MQIQKEVKLTLELNGKEFNIIDQCLRYARHRLQEHSDSGIEGWVDLEKLEKLINEIDEIKKIDK